MTMKTRDNERWTFDDVTIDEIEKKISYVFHDKNLLVTAFTHSSYCNEHSGSTSYERLEFLGDSILGFLMADKLYFGTDENEGGMTVMRAGSVSKEPLADKIDKMGVIKYLRHGNGVEPDFKSSIKTRSDLFESIIAAMYVDSGRSLEAPANFVKNLDVTKGRDYKSVLQEYVQKQYCGLIPKYDTSEAPNKNGRFVSRAIVGDDCYDSACGKNKKTAEQKAAEIAYKKLTSDNA